MAKLVKKRSKYLPSKDLIQRRLNTLSRLLRKEAQRQTEARKKTREDRLTPTEMLEWAVQIESILK